MLTILETTDTPTDSWIGRLSSRRVLVAVMSTALLSGACGKAPGSSFVVTGQALAGPVCPVETNPPDPDCAPRPVAGAIVAAVSELGDRVETTTGADGRFSFDLPAGRYEIAAQPAEGLMGTPDSIEVEATSGSIDLGVLMYDTGIR